MKKFISYIIIFTVFYSQVTGQTISINKYMTMCEKADSLYLKNDYLTAANLYVKAFKANNDLGKVIHRFKAAECFAMIKSNDNAFYQLEKISIKANFADINMLLSNDHFINIHNDPRWLKIIEIVKRNMENTIIF